MIKKGDRIITALSGGSDSVAMLLLLCDYSRENPDLSLEIEAFHFNHKLRGEDADGDEIFCKELCEKLGVKFTSKSGNVKEYSEKTGKSIEEAARDLRYEALFEYAGNDAKIAVAHNKNDRQETVLFNIARGTSIDGLRGIRYTHKNIIRPLLDITKEQTLEVCESHGVGFRTDKTNFETDATRNKIRLNVIPFIDGELGVDFGSKLTELSDLAEQDGDYMNAEAKKALEKCAEKNRLDFGMLAGYHVAIKSRVVRMMIANAEADGKKPFADNVSITKQTVLRALDFGENGTSGAYIEIGKGVVAKKHGNVLIFSGGEENAEENVRLVSEEIPEDGLRDAVKKCRESKEMSVVFDKDKLFEMTDGAMPEFRTIKTGDVFSPLGGTGKKPLRRFFTDCKIENEARKNIRLLAVGNEIIHVFGVRRSKYASIHNGSKCGIMFNIIFY